MPLSLLIFSYLQILDLMSTVAFMMLGVREANPLVRFAFTLAHNPLAGLLMVKLTVVMLEGFAAGSEVGSAFYLTRISCSPWWSRGISLLSLLQRPR